MCKTTQQRLAESFFFDFFLLEPLIKPTKQTSIQPDTHPPIIHLVKFKPKMPKIYFVGVDVGTSSARAALITSDGKVLKQAVRNIRIWNPEHEYFEQSSDDIWNAVRYCVKVC